MLVVWWAMASLLAQDEGCLMLIMIARAFFYGVRVCLKRFGYKEELMFLTIVSKLKFQWNDNRFRAPCRIGLLADSETRAVIGR